jgi:hypothetical protein
MPAYIHTISRHFAVRDDGLKALTLIPNGQVVSYEPLGPGTGRSLSRGFRWLAVYGVRADSLGNTTVSGG